jgi:hypothetical protein
MFRPLLFFCATSLGLLSLGTSVSTGNVLSVEYCNKALLFAESQAGGKSLNYAPSREIDILNQVIDVTPDFDRKSVSGKVTIAYKPIAKALAELRLDAVNLQIN